LRHVAAALSASRMQDSAVGHSWQARLRRLSWSDLLCLSRLTRRA